MAITDAAQADLVRLRRELHSAPEVGLDLPGTQRTLLAELAGLPLEITLGRGSTSITAVLRGAHPDRPEHAPAVLLRSDMDGLPVTEPDTLSFHSQNSGTMHACGHDLHMAMLIGAARELSSRRDELCGDVVLMFQPGEEGCGGAALMIEEGVLDAAGPRVSSAFGLHVFTGDPRPARFGFRAGTAMAFAASLDVTIIGRGGHGSAPHLASDPVPTVAETVLALQSATTRRFNALDPVVVTVGRLSAGTASNIIPDSAHLAATVRGFSHASHELAAEVLPTIAHGIAAAHGQRAEVTFRPEFPPVVNTASEAAIAIDVARSLFGAEQVEELENPKTASEDFAEILELVPGVFGFVDATPAEGSDYNHSPHAVYDDAVLGAGATLHAEFAIARLAALCS
ncbi:hippurate hydrolase [Leucobacter luti]|uniref:M20 metallopeptidase family protein n=1 Tax=Leucobacter luti TaxID=340320 RepID=UPI001042B5D1|nr:M20 family metallopeptidase [Leucobacter luti]MCW2289791.1 hippurate hydrolase [Leucobacter luti]TCK34327.1 hippurate hydrolase [Leucobacter luti]